MTSVERRGPKERPAASGEVKLGVEERGKVKGEQVQGRGG